MSVSLARPLLGAIGTLAVLAACDGESPSAAPTDPLRPSAAHAVVAAAQPTVASAREQIVEVVAALDVAWNTKNPAAYAAPFDVNARLIAPTGALVISRAGVQGLHAFLFNGPFKGSTRETVSLDITFLSGTLAVVDRVGDLTNYAFLPPGTSPSAPNLVRQRERLIMEFRGGEWRIVFSQLTGVAPSAL